MMFSRLIGLAIPLVFVLGSLLACGQKTETGELGATCESDGDCKQGQACLVTPSFLQDSTAATDVTAASGLPASTLDQFVPAPDPAPESTTDETKPDVKTCQIPCRADVDCPSGFACLSGSEDAETGLCIDESRTAELEANAE